MQAHFHNDVAVVENIDNSLRVSFVNKHVTLEIISNKDGIHVKTYELVEKNGRYYYDESFSTVRHGTA